MSLRRPLPVSASQLATDILDSVNIAPTVGQSVTLVDDINRSQVVLDRLVNYINTGLPNAAKNVVSMAGSSKESIIQNALSILPGYLKTTVDNLRSQTIQSAGGYRITATLMGHETKVFTALSQLELLSSVLFDIPARAVRTKAERYWNTVLAPDYPSERDMVILAQNGYLPWDTLTRYFKEELGLNDLWAKQLTFLRQCQTGKPSLRDAYLMVKKGLKPEKFFYDVAMFGQGWSRQDAEALYSHYDYDPGVSELLRLSDLLPLSSSWIESKLDSLGLNKTDKQVFKAAIEQRNVRDELGKIMGLLYDIYQWGLISTSEFTKFLADSKASAAEITYRVQIGELMKLKLRVKLLRDAQIYLYRKDALNEQQLYNNLVALNIAADIANALVKNEAAKKGIEWELE